ncbi:MAG: vacuolar-type H+-ATPase subunit D/Vma8 [Arenicella sp.]|jgi:vacuolar-type H+-ATPase subunit D/Vma8
MKSKLLIVLLSVCIISCASYKSTTSSSTYRHGSVNRGMEDYDKKDISKKKSDRLVIKNASITLVVKEVDNIYTKLEEISSTYEGYISSSSNSYATIRVKSESLESALEKVALLGKVKDKSIRTQDVTASYTDSKIRMENAEKARKRYLELLQKATKVSEILPLEKEIERLTGEIERMKGQLNLFDNQIAYSTINISWQKKTKPGPIGYVFVGLFKAVKVLFVRN